MDFWQQEYAFFVQDTWRMRPNFTLNYGVRYEAQINPQPDEPNPALAGSDQIPSDNNNFAPRVGFSWDPVERQSRRRALQHRASSTRARRRS